MKATEPEWAGGSETVGGLGVVMLDSASLTLPRAVGLAETFSMPVTYATAQGATGEIVSSQRFAEAEAAYGNSGVALVRNNHGIALTSNCGFAVVYQDRLREATGAPTALSSLLLVPLLARVYGNRFGILTYDASQLDGPRRAASGWPDGLDIPIVDVIDSPSWVALSGPPSANLDTYSMRQDVLAAASRLVSDHSVDAILLECTGFCPFAEEIALESGLPTYDIVRLVEFLFGRSARSLPPERPRSPEPGPSSTGGGEKDPRR